MAPLTDAMRFIDGQQRDVAFCERCEKLGLSKSLGCHIQQAEATFANCLVAIFALIAIERRVDESG